MEGVRVTKCISLALACFHIRLVARLRACYMTNARMEWAKENFGHFLSKITKVSRGKVFLAPKSQKCLRPQMLMLLLDWMFCTMSGNWRTYYYWAMELGDTGNVVEHPSCWKCKVSTYMKICPNLELSFVVLYTYYKEE